MPLSCLVSRFFGARGPGCLDGPHPVQLAHQVQSQSIADQLLGACMLTGMNGYGADTTLKLTNWLKQGVV